MTRRPLQPPARQRPAALAAGLLAIVGAFQAALALGAPWGEAAYGGAHRGVLPPRYRAASAVASAVYGALTLITLGRGPGATARRRILSGGSALMLLGTVMNLASRSRLERTIWTPVAGTLALTLLRLARGVPTGGRRG
ncbi:hypothetical protein [Arthrobacter agilis]|uniref:hypothetical protein n=1 Tax=Arthrobacter agilis TaxID=37921 RepID=UPI002789A844|nr:hypothetical protein [Arthrobacter agilis]MDQ0736400.1 hypothetical protein [Arthrobacter agilis]